jgi:hypothetical protein
MDFLTTPWSVIQSVHLGSNSTEVTLFSLCLVGALFQFVLDVNFNN